MSIAEARGTGVETVPGVLGAAIILWYRNVPIYDWLKFRVAGEGQKERGEGGGEDELKHALVISISFVWMNR